MKNRKESFAKGSKGAVKDLLLYTSAWGFDLKKIKSKVYLFYGEVDKNVTLAMGSYYHKQIKRSKLTVYPNEGHKISITHAEDILKTLI